MIIKVPFYYSIKGVPRGARNERDFDIRDEVEIEIAELTSEDAPAVAILPAAWREGFLMRKDEIAPRPIRHDGIGFLRERELTLYLQEGTKRVLPVRTEDLAAEGKDMASILHLSNTRAWQYEKSIPLDSLVLRHDPDLSDRDVTIAGIAKSAARYAIVDGVLHERCPEPVIRLHYGSWHRGEHYPNWFDVAVDFTAEGDHRGDLVRTWNLPEFLNDRDHWTSLYGDDKPAEIHDLEDIQVLDPSAFRYDPTPHLALRALQCVCENAAKRLAESRSIEFVADYFMAQDLYDSIAGQPAPDHVEPMVDALTRIGRHERGGNPIVTCWDNAWARPLQAILNRRAAISGIDPGVDVSAAPNI